MIDCSKINAGFQQTGVSCVLASYAIAHSYFTSLPIRVCFEDYCRHFALSFSNWKDAEQKYAGHFDKESKRRNCLGYELVLDLHYHSSEIAFVVGRKHFDSILYRDSAPHCNYLENYLRTHEAILNITFDAGPNYHSVSAFANATEFLKKDTEKPGLESFRALPVLGNLRDSLLHIKR